ncbi:GntR family transcriptional regulator [Mesorhizobium sp. M0322]
MRLRDPICDGTLRPGDRLVEASVAKMLGVSRTPLREPIEKLLVEGLLSNSPSRGVVVTELSRSPVIQIYALRGVLEGAAAGFAAQHASQAEIDELVSIHEPLGTLLDAPDRLLKANRRFHNAIHSAAHNQYLIEATSRLADALSLLPGTAYSAAGRPQAAQAEHGTIIDAIVRRDAKDAEIQAREHIESARRVRLRPLFEAQQSQIVPDASVAHVDERRPGPMASARRDQRFRCAANSRMSRTKNDGSSQAAKWPAFSMS